MKTRLLRRDERGIILVTALLFLVVLTLLGIAMFRSSGLMDHIAANTREKQRSFESAQAALQYGEWWLQTIGTDKTPQPCPQFDPVIANLHVCNQNLPADFADTMANGNGLQSGGVKVGFEYTPANMKADPAGGLVAGSADINYKHLPGVYIEYKGVSLSGTAQLYQVTAYGYGGSDGTNAVVQSTYQVTSASSDLTP